MKTVFMRVLEADDKAAALLEAIRDSETALGARRFEVDPGSFGSVPRSPFAYWVSEQMRALFTSLPPLESGNRVARRTNSVDNDFRFVRLYWEVESRLLNDWWQPWAKGGAYSPFYYDVDTVISWDKGRSTYPGFLGTDNRPLERPASVQHFFRPGLTWPRRTNGLSLRVMPVGCIFADKGPAAFVDGDDANELLALASITNSRAFGLLVSLQLARTELAQSYEVGLIQNTPVPRLAIDDKRLLAVLARRAWSLKRSVDTRTETSHAFTIPALLQVNGTTLADRSIEWADHVRRIEIELDAIQSEIDTRCFDLYGIDEADRLAITDGFGAQYKSDDGGEVATENDAESDTDDDGETGADITGLTEELIAWTIGVAFGRFDVRLATGARPLPAEPDPFDPLPVCSPAMLTGDDGLPLTRAPAGYPIAFPENGLLADDPGHSRDLTAAVRAVFDVVFSAAADDRWNEAAAILDPKERDLRNWLAKGFFEHHLKRHSKSRRKAPILWQLATPSSSYSVWLYAHRLTKDSLFQVQNDLIAQRLDHEERKLRTLLKAAGQNPNASQRKEIAHHETLLDELRAMFEEVKRVAPLWNPNLNDGIVLTMAPLWRLVPHHKAWQKELRNAWDALADGKFDWSHLAMHLWPERVVPKCTTDRSLAISHGLEDVFWNEDTDGKWKPRKIPALPVDDLVRERTSPAVKAALKSLMDVPRAVERALGRKPRRK